MSTVEEGPYSLRKEGTNMGSYSIPYFLLKNTGEDCGQCMANAIQNYIGLWNIFL